MQPVGSRCHMNKRLGIRLIVTGQRPRLKPSLLMRHNNYANHILGIYHCHSCRASAPRSEELPWNESVTLTFITFITRKPDLSSLFRKTDSHPPTFISARLHLNGTTSRFSHTADCFGCCWRACTCVCVCVCACGCVVVSAARWGSTRSAVIGLPER